jgi:hypothetical protein
MLKKSVILVFSILVYSSGYASIKDTIQYYLNFKKPSLIGGLSGRNTIIGSHYTSVSGVAIGADYGGKIRFLGGVYGLSSPLVERKIINAYTKDKNVVDEISRFWYFGVTGAYTFFKDKRWTLNVPLRIGFGTANIEQHDTGRGKLLIAENNSFIVPIESGIGVQYNIAWWIGLSAGLGSRIVVGKSTSQKFSGTYYNYGINIYFSDIYYHIRNDMKKNPHPKSKLSY